MESNVQQTYEGTLRTQNKKIIRNILEKKKIQTNIIMPPKTHIIYFQNSTLRIYINKKEIIFSSISSLNRQTNQMLVAFQFYILSL